MFAQIAYCYKTSTRKVKMPCCAMEHHKYKNMLQPLDSSIYVGGKIVPQNTLLILVFENLDMSLAKS